MADPQDGIDLTISDGEDGQRIRERNDQQDDNDFTVRRVRRDVQGIISDHNDPEDESDLTVGDGVEDPATGDDDNEDEEQEAELEVKIQIFMRAFVEKVIYTAEPMEYPPTSAEGIAVVYDVSAWDTPAAAFQDNQYASGRPGGGPVEVNCKYLGCKVKKETRTCQGVKMCEYVADNLRQMTHCSVDPNDPVFQPLLELGDLLPSPEESIKFQTKA
ncbi:hypothetical protein DFS34DRAFT_645600 [Phlyctochytrium arcticum]|nr:hypothetical protein DFS34DRAFT_645600 [Phlyctochytrium arcticum]